MIEAVLVEKHVHRHNQVLFCGSMDCMKESLKGLGEQWERNESNLFLELDRQGDDVIACHSARTGELVFAWQILDLRDRAVLT